jgi:hypothetical protein
LSMVFYRLNLLAFIAHMILERGNRLYQRCLARTEDTPDHASICRMRCPRAEPDRSLQIRCWTSGRCSERAKYLPGRELLKLSVQGCAREESRLKCLLFYLSAWLRHDEFHGFHAG